MPGSHVLPGMKGKHAPKALGKMRQEAKHLNWGYGISRACCVWGFGGLYGVF